MPDQSFDLVILGGGSGGYAAALRASELGMTVGMIEKDKVGGTCLHRGCIPTKALLHAAEIADAARDSEQYGIRASLEGIDVAGVTKYRTGIVAKKFRGLQSLLKARNVTTIDGLGTLTSATTVRVGDATITGKHIVLATGSYSRSLPGLELGGRVIDSEQALNLEYVPKKVAVLGGGVIGVEFASKLGIRFKEVRQDDSGVVVTLENGETIEADLLLVAVGRGPATSNSGFAEAGVAIDRGFVTTNERLETSLPGVYAVGDIVFGLQLAHRSFQQGIFVAEELAGLNPAIVSDTNIPRITYCEPEVASVGLTEAKAVEQYGRDAIAAYDFSLAGNAKSEIIGTTGSVKVVRRKDGPVLGVHALGSRVGELMGEAQLAVNWEAYPEDVAPYLHGHPTQYEALGEAFLALAGKPLHAL